MFRLDSIASCGGLSKRTVQISMQQCESKRSCTSCHPSSQCCLKHHLFCHQRPAGVPHEQQKEAVADEVMWLCGIGKAGFAWGRTDCMNQCCNMLPCKGFSQAFVLAQKLFQNAASYTV